MTLRGHIFLWVVLAALVPLTALALAATYYSQHTYQREVEREITTSLNNLAAEVERRLVAEQETLLGLARSRAVRDFLPVLEEAAAGARHPEFQMRSAQINRFFEDFHNVLPGFYTLRVLDPQGNSVVKISNGRRSHAVYDSLEGIPYVEQEIADPGFADLLQSLPPNEISYLFLPHNRAQADPSDFLPMLDYVIPLAAQGEIVGALTVSVRGQQLDRIVDHAPRLYRGQLFIAEINPEMPARDGALLYDDAASLRFSGLRMGAQGFAQRYGERVWEQLSAQPYGVLQQPRQTTIYHVELFPYPNLLVNWVVGTRVENAVIAAPFRSIRYGIWLFAAAALLFSLVLANVGTRKITQPVCRLAQNLKAFADGSRRLRVSPQGIQELQTLASSFNYMAETLERARLERDKAQHMMLQNAKLASIGQMAAGIGHEINNPLNNILSLAKLIERGLPAADTRLQRDVASLREEAVRASEIVRGILNFARQVPPHYAAFPVCEWVDSTLALVRQQAKDQQVSLEARCETPHNLEGDRGQLQQALINLLLNAIHASSPGGRVDVDVQPAGDMLQVSVSDHGHGIDETTMDKVFDPFFTTKPVGEGSGLGLSISLGIVDFHRGTLTLRNNADGGVTATMTLPLHARAQEQESTLHLGRER